MHLLHDVGRACTEADTVMHEMLRKHVRYRTVVYKS